MNNEGEIAWVSRIENTTEVRKRCIRLFVRIAKRNAKFRSNPETIVPCIAGIAIPSTNLPAAKPPRHLA
jgi:hypothetical protein